MASQPDRRAAKWRRNLLAFMESRGLKVAPWARDSGISLSAPRNFLNGDTESLSLATAYALARSQNVTIEELFDPEFLRGRIKATDGQHMGNTPDLPAAAPSAHHYVPVKYLEVGAGAGGPRKLGESEENQEILIPEAVVRGQLAALPAHLIAFPVVGHSMLPLLHDGSVVVVDTRKTVLGGGGLFGFDEGDGAQVKWLERVSSSDPPKVRIISENKRFEPQERLASELTIIGMIVWSMGRIG